ncbi:MAG: serine protease [Tenericutes bacterium]|jgi:serine protease Do|nr:serine protease [Mycoplasmatota bacterium]
MKRFFSFLLMGLLIISLSGCTEVITYDDLYQDYQTHLNQNEPIYQSYIDYFNHISTETIKSVVSVKKTVFASSGSMTGSGVIFFEDSLYYYVLTNNHVVYEESNYSVNYSVGDYNGNNYSATLVANSSAYDLGIVRFRKGSEVLDVIEFALENTALDTNIAILGYPSFQINAITLGVAIDYSVIDIENPSTDIINVDFSVLVATAPVKSGSSGSVVINDLYELIGIVYAGNFTNSSDVSQYAFIIPVEKVYEFFEDVEFDFGGDSE